MFNNYRIRKIDNSYFLTTDQGTHTSLSEEEFKKLKRLDLDEELSKKLKDSLIIIEDIDKLVMKSQKRNSFLFQGTSLHIMVLTKRCNMGCVYCHASRENENKENFDMNLENAKKTVDFIFQSPSKDITIEFQGGEPLLNWNILKEVVEYAHEKNKILCKNLKIDLVTNMSLMDDEKMIYLIQKDIGVCTSLDGPKELHDKNRPFNKSNYEQVIFWIKKFNNEYKLRRKNQRVNALVTITKESLNYSSEIINEYHSLGLKDIHLRFLNNLGFAKKSWEKISYTPEEFITFWNKSIDYINKNKIDIKERGYNIIFSKLNNDVDPNYLELRNPCGAVIGQLAYNYDGKIFTCDEARMLEDDLFMVGDVNQKFIEVVACDKTCTIVNSSINDQFICDNCVYKTYCGLCPVCNYSEQGNIIAKIPETSRCKIYMAEFDKVVRENFINLDK